MDVFARSTTVRRLRPRTDAVITELTTSGPFSAWENLENLNYTCHHRCDKHKLFVHRNFIDRQ